MRQKLILAVAALALAACGENPLKAVEAEIARQESAAASQGAAAAAEVQTFLDAQKARPGAQATASGLIYEKVRAAPESVAQPSASDTVRVHYEGTLADGTVFDSSYARNEPAEFRLDQVIPGWTEGVQLMRPGEEFRFVIPPAIGYGEQGAPPSIPPNAALVFKVELLSFVTADGKTVAAPR